MTYGEYCESYDGSEIFSSLSSLSATPCLVLPRALRVDAVDIFLSSIYIGFQGKYFFFLFSFVMLLCLICCTFMFCLHVFGNGSLLSACRMGNVFVDVCALFYSGLISFFLLFPCHRYG